MRAFLTIILLVISNVLMTFAWYGNFKLRELNISNNWPLYVVILVSWGIAFFEYCVMIPANMLGAKSTGGPFSLVQLKVTQEIISLVVFTIIIKMIFQGEAFLWNHIAAFICIVLAVFFVFLK